MPEDIKPKVANIRQRYRGWGRQANSLAANRIIAACGRDKALVQVVITAMLRAPVHRPLIAAIRKQLA